MPMFPFPDVGSVGYNADIPDHDLIQPDGVKTTQMAWSSVRNFGFRGGVAERAKGFGSGFGTVQQIPYFLTAATKTDGTPYVVAGGTTKVYSYNGSTATDISKSATTYSATADTRWTGGVFTGFVVLNNTVENPQFCAISNLGSANALTDLTNWPASTTCKVFRPFKYFLVAGYMTESATAYPYKVRWSASAVPGALPASWVATAANDAGSVDLSENDGEIVDMLALGDQLAIFRRNGVWLMRYVGGLDAANRLVMAFNRVQLSAASGLVASNCADVVPGLGLIAMSESDVYLFNGNTATSVLNNRTRRWLFNNMDTTNKKRSFLVTNARDSEVLICFPTSGNSSCDTAIVWNYADDTVGHRDLTTATCGIAAVINAGTSGAWSSYSGAWSAASTTWASTAALGADRKLILGSAGTKIYVIGDKTDADGSTFTAQLQRTGLTLGDPERVKYIKEVWPKFNGNTGDTVEITVGAQMAPDEIVTWGIPQNYTIGTSRKVDVNLTGRYLGIRLRSTSGGVWKLKSLDANVVPLGAY